MVTSAVVAAAQSSAGKAVARKVKEKLTGTGKKGIVKALVTKRRRTRLLTLGQREELMWISRHLGRTAAAERMMHYRR
jgi:hypothetical protein